MKSVRKELWVVFPEKQGVLNITKDVDEFLKASGIQEGLCLVSAANVTSSIFTNSDEADMHVDFMGWLEKLAPHNPEKKETNSDSELSFLDTHLKRTLVGKEVVWPLQKTSWN